MYTNLYTAAGVFAGRFVPVNEDRILGTLKNTTNFDCILYFKQYDPCIKSIVIPPKSSLSIANSVVGECIADAIEIGAVLVFLEAPR